MDELAIGNYAYSSWSLRGWLLYDAFDVPKRTRYAAMRTAEFSALMQEFAPTRLVPAALMDTGDGQIFPVWDSLAMAETLSERFPDKGFWPSDARQRAVARSLTAEMHSGFSALRSECPMNLHLQYTNFEATADVIEDLQRLEELWHFARETSQTHGPWLFGSYSIADVFFAPVATRIITHQLSVSEAALDYCYAHLAHSAFRRWRAMAVAENLTVDRYAKPCQSVPFPFPERFEARAVVDRTAENANCPYSGRPVSPDSIAEINGHVVGFCNPFCRDKSVADAEVWPALQALIGR